MEHLNIFCRETRWILQLIFKQQGVGMHLVCLTLVCVLFHPAIPTSSCNISVAFYTCLEYLSEQSIQHILLYSLRDAVGCGTNYGWATASPSKREIITWLLAKYKWVQATVPIYEPRPMNFLRSANSIEIERCGRGAIVNGARTPWACYKMAFCD